MPLTPPSFFVNAVSLAEVRALEMLAGTRACGRLVTASNNNSKMSVSSNNTFRCSQVHPLDLGSVERQR